MGSRTCIGETGMRVLTEQCETCIFRPGNLMHLNPGRLAGMVADIKAKGGYVTCHESLDLPPRRRVICRGSFDRLKTQIIQLAERMNFIEWVNPKEAAVNLAYSLVVTDVGPDMGPRDSRFFKVSLEPPSSHSTLNPIEGRVRIIVPSESDRPVVGDRYLVTLRRVGE